LDSAWLMTVLPQPNAPGMAHVPAQGRPMRQAAWALHASLACSL